MILNLKEFQDVCKTILNAVDNSEISTDNETLELKTESNILYLNVTNNEYYASVKFTLAHEEEFHATVNANLFLKLINTSTTETVELKIKDNYMYIKANGNYKLPLVFNNDKLLELPKIEIANKTVEMNIPGETLLSILEYNSKELSKNSAAHTVQKMYYVDQEGCFTFSTGACINNFTLEKPIKILLNNRLVKLFKLFKEDMVQFTLGFDALQNDIIQTKVKFETPKIKLTAILNCKDELINKVPVAALRVRANKEYPYTVVINKAILNSAINRLSLFNIAIGKFYFEGSNMYISDPNDENVEKVELTSSSEIPYSMHLNLQSIKSVLDTCNEQYFNLSFGDNQSVVLSRANVKNVLPEYMMN